MPNFEAVHKKVPLTSTFVGGGTRKSRPTYPALKAASNVRRIKEKNLRNIPHFTVFGVRRLQFQQVKKQ